METHAEPTPRRRTATRLKWAALLTAAAVIIFAAFSHVSTGLRVADLTKKLRHPDDPTRAAAVKELGELGSAASSAIPILLDLLRNDQSNEVSVAVVNALWKIGPDTNAGSVWLRSQLKDKDAAVRTHAVFILGSHRPHQFFELLRLRRRWVREAVAALCEASNDEDKLVRWMAVTSIMRYAGPDTAEAVPTLIHALDDEPLSTRRHALIALGRIGPPAYPAIPALVGVFRRTYPTIQENGQSYEMPQVYALKMFAGIALGKIGPRAIPEVIELLKDPNSVNCTHICMAFPKIGAEAVPHLAELLQDPQVGTRRCAAEAIGKFGTLGADAVPALSSALKDSDENVRANAAFSLGWIGGAARPAVPLLAESLKNERAPFSILFALGEMGAEAREAVPALLAFIGDEKRPYHIRGRAVLTLLKIAPETKESLSPLMLEQGEEARKSDEEFSQRFDKTAEQEVNPMYR